MEHIKKFEAFIGGDKSKGSPYLKRLVEHIIEYSEDIKLLKASDFPNWDPSAGVDTNFIYFEFNDDKYILVKDTKALSFGYSEDSGTINYLLPKDVYKKLLSALKDVENEKQKQYREKWKKEEELFNAQPEKRYRKYNRRVK